MATIVLWFALFFGLSLSFWGLMGLVRLLDERLMRLLRQRTYGGVRWHRYSKRWLGRAASQITVDEVAVLIAARNEAEQIGSTIESLIRIARPHNVYVASDGSSDSTADIARKLGCRTIEIQPNGGKARALQRLLDDFNICKRYKAILLLDADCEIDSNYFKYALPLFSNPAIVAIAGHVFPKWHHHGRPRLSQFYTAYRLRLYFILQALVRYGQTWRLTNMSYIVPGACSMYRTDVLPHINITAPGLIIEDFNMTFEVHHKRLGRIAYAPKAFCRSHEPHTLVDYVSQLKRWNLGFWQTAARHRIWLSPFCFFLYAFIAETLLISLIWVVAPVFLWFIVADALSQLTVFSPYFDLALSDVGRLLIAVFLIDYAFTIAIALIERKPVLMIYGLGFVFVRWIDAVVAWYALVLSLFVRSDGRWKSPTRVIEKGAPHSTQFQRTAAAPELESQG